MHHCKRIMSAILCLGIVGFAIASLSSSGELFSPHGQPMKLQAADDPVRNGLRILETRSRGQNIQHQANEEPAVILLDNWVFTDKSGTSPYQ